MAEIRKSGKQAAARKAARERAVERAAEFRRRQEQLEELAAEYFVAADAADGINEDAEAQIVKIREAQAAAIADADRRSQEIVQKMLDTKVTRDEVAERLGVPVREIRRAKPKAGAPTESPAPEGESETAASSVGDAGADEGDAEESHAA
ncbi:hypothetical protein [Frondihabitans sp. VKM Ac-2883]|uniref:hypothetical protein n=1 Tax=Frondihabitans sp. VKM Ac-2883 TaxID=2783823 RepID=UPI00188B0D44|nr:hypothetical protein [Frondihabitans sp. VKM Ac-2883]MBF4577490.1 hypothetical protein [Frondihabitans sp. VKM Ac-2883]